MALCKYHNEKKYAENRSDRDRKINDKLLKATKKYKNENEWLMSHKALTTNECHQCHITNEMSRSELRVLLITLAHQFMSQLTAINFRLSLLTLFKH